MVKNRGLCFFMPKKNEKSDYPLQLCRIFQDPIRSEIHDYGLKMFLKVLELFSVLDFFKNDFEKSYCGSKNVGHLRPPWGSGGLRSF